MISGIPLFRGRDNNDQLNQIIRILGTPDEATLRRIASESVRASPPVRVGAFELTPFASTARGSIETVPPHDSHPVELTLPESPPARYALGTILDEAFGVLTVTVSSTFPALDLLDKLLQFDPARRLDCTSALHQ